MQVYLFFFTRHWLCKCFVMREIHSSHLLATLNKILPSTPCLTPFKSLQWRVCRIFVCSIDIQTILFMYQGGDFMPHMSFPPPLILDERFSERHHRHLFAFDPGDALLIWALNGPEPIKSLRLVAVGSRHLLRSLLSLLLTSQRISMQDECRSESRSSSSRCFHGTTHSSHASSRG